MGSHGPKPVSFLRIPCSGWPNIQPFGSLARVLVGPPFSEWLFMELFIRPYNSSFPTGFIMCKLLGILSWTNILVGWTQSTVAWSCDQFEFPIWCLHVGCQIFVVCFGLTNINTFALCWGQCYLLLDQPIFVEQSCCWGALINMKTLDGHFLWANILCTFCWSVKCCIIVVAVDCPTLDNSSMISHAYAGPTPRLRLEEVRSVLTQAVSILFAEPNFRSTSYKVAIGLPLITGGRGYGRYDMIVIYMYVSLQLSLMFVGSQCLTRWRLETIYS